MRNIGIGSWGEDVKTLQQILVSLGYNIKVDGIFGVETQKAVKDFQERHVDDTGAPLIVDGIVGPKTWWALTHATSAMVPAASQAPRPPATAAWLGLAAIAIGLYFLWR